METRGTYPTSDAEHATSGAPLQGARIAAVEPDSPAYDAGFEPGCLITSVDGQPLRDVIDWRWLSGEEAITVGYVDLDGEVGEVELWREPGEEWGFEFEGLVFDGVKLCRNACTFCFMRMLPPDMRKSLYLRDDDFRLSFLVGTFVTFTNLNADDEARIVEQRISPLRVSLQASNPDVRKRLIGRHAQHGLDVLDRLLAKGIEFHAQIVLVPDQNDGDVLVETLEWAWERPGILDVGIVPLGYTRFQTAFDHSFNDPAAARGLLDLVAPFQQRALHERGHAWVFAADEFHRNAYRDDLLEHVPPTSYYGDFSMFEDGIGIIRSTIDEWDHVQAEGAIECAANALREAGMRAIMVVGCAQREFLSPLAERAGITDVFEPLYVENAFFGGNVDVTGLLVGEDIVRAVRGWIDCPSCRTERAEESLSSCHSERSEESPRSGLSGFPLRGDPSPSAQDDKEMAARDDKAMAAQDGGLTARDDTEMAAGDDGLTAWDDTEMAARDDGLTAGDDGLTAWDDGRASSPLFLVPRVVFNDNGLTLDGMVLEDMEKAAGQPLHVVSCSPLQYFDEIAALVAAQRG